MFFCTFAILIISNMATNNQPVSQPVNVKQTFVFGRINYILMLTGLAFLALGYLLMIGGKSNDPNVFNQELFSTQRIILSPILLVIGFIIEGIAIMYRPKKKEVAE